MRILLFLPNWIGDVILTTPAFRALKKANPDTYTGCVLPSRAKGVLLNNPYVDEIIEFDERTSHRSFFKKIAFVRSIANRKFDVALLLHRSMTRALLCLSAGIATRIGYHTPKRAWLLTKAIPQPDRDSVHKQDYYLDVVKSFGVTIDDTNCEVFVSEAQRKKAQDLIRRHSEKKSTCVALSPFTNWGPKDWPLDYFKDLVSLLRRRDASTTFYITAKKKDPQLTAFFKNDMPLRLVELSGGTTLSEVAALYEQMDLVVSGDSGPLHIAASVGTNYIGIFGPTNPDLFAPRARARGIILFENDSCPTPCYQRDCRKGLICMQKIKPQAVYEAACTLLD